MVVILIFGAFIAGAVAGLFYLVTRFRRFLLSELWREHWEDRRRQSWLIAMIPVLFFVLYCLLDMVNGVIVTVNVVVIWLIADFAGWLIRRFRKRPARFYYEGAAAILFSVIYLGSGWYFAHHVYETDYRLSTEKDLGMDRLRIVQISDSHVGATFYGDGFAKHMETVQKTNPDLVVLTGDYVDDGTTKEDLIKCSEALGKLKATYGVYYIFGNHDRGYFNSRDFDEADLRAELEKNNVRILEDEAVDIGSNIVLIGRQDRSTPGRADMEALVEGIPGSQYIIVLDHQPHDFAAQTEAEVDLVLCGHTHGGQMFPVGITGELSGANDKTYGYERREGTDFIVNSGISDWAIKYKTGGAIAEFGVIDIVSESGN